MQGSIRFAENYIDKHFAGVEYAPVAGTYMMFLDCTKWCEAHGEMIQEVLKVVWDVGVA